MYAYIARACDHCVVLCAAEQTIIDDAVDKWRERLHFCMKANSRHFKPLLWRFHLG